MSDLQNFGRFNEFLQTKCWNTFSFWRSEEDMQFHSSQPYRADGNTTVFYKCESVFGLRNCDPMSESAKYDMRPLLHASVILAECLHLLSTIPKRLYLSAVGIEHWPKNHWNVSLNIQYFGQNTNTHDSVALNRKRHLFEYIKAVFKSSWMPIGDKLIHEISSARDGQLLGTFSTPIFLLLSSNSFRRSLIKTIYKKVDRTPCLTPWLTLNHFDFIWFTMTELVVCWWQLLISVHILPQHQYYTVLT